MFVPRFTPARDGTSAPAVLLTVLFAMLLFAVPPARALRPPVTRVSSTHEATYRIIAAPSPHYRAVAHRVVDTIVVHYASAINTQPKRWWDAQAVMAIFGRYRVSAHYLIDRDGRIYQLVDERHVAWHAGGSIMPAPDTRRNVNRFSIGIELIGTGNRPFTDRQYRALAHLVGRITARHAITRIVGHDQIAGARAVRLGLRTDVKADPGPTFDWGRLRGMLQEAGRWPGKG